MLKSSNTLSGWILVPQIVINVNKKVKRIVEFYLKVAHLKYIEISYSCWCWKRGISFGTFGLILHFRSTTIFMFSTAPIQMKFYLTAKSQKWSNLVHIRTGKSHIWDFSELIQTTKIQFREYRLKKSQNYSTDYFVYYREHRTYFFSRDTTPAQFNIEDEIITVNPIFMVNYYLNNSAASKSDD